MFSIYARRLSRKKLTFVSSLTAASGGLVYYQNAQYLYKHKCDHGDSLERPLSLDATLSYYTSCIFIASY
jgi:hypothetical protein